MKNNTLNKKSSEAFTQPRMLTSEELEELKQDMWEASARLRQMKLPENRKKHNLPDWDHSRDDDE